MLLSSRGTVYGRLFLAIVPSPDRAEREAHRLLHVLAEVPMPRSTAAENARTLAGGVEISWRRGPTARPVCLEMSRAFPIGRTMTRTISKTATMLMKTTMRVTTPTT